MKKDGFTLIELLIVVSILLILVAMLVPAINKSIEINREKLAKELVEKQKPVVYETPEPGSSEATPEPEPEEDLEYLEPGQYLYYVSYFMNGSNPGACTVVMDNVVTNFASVYGESNSLASYIRMRASKNNLKVNSLIVNSFQLINHKLPNE